MTDLERREFISKQHKFMKEREQLEALQTQRSNKLECFHCLEMRMQALDEEADRIEWILQNGDKT